MVPISIDKLKKSQQFIDEIRWDVTPKIFFEPSYAQDDESGKPVDITHGYMLYVDLVNDKPALVIMQLKRIMSKTVGYVHDIPEELLREALHCQESDCVGGMYPLNNKLVGWLKKEFGLS